MVGVCRRWKRQTSSLINPQRRARPTLAQTESDLKLERERPLCSEPRRGYRSVSRFGRAEAVLRLSIDFRVIRGTLDLGSIHSYRGPLTLKGPLPSPSLELPAASSSPALQKRGTNARGNPPCLPISAILMLTFVPYQSIQLVAAFGCPLHKPQEEDPF